MCVVQNGDGSEVIFTIFELAGMAEERYAGVISIAEAAI